MTIKDVTGIVVTHNTKDLIQRCIESIRKFHPTMRIMIVDGSDVNDPCRHYVKQLSDEFTEVILCDHNIGHGKGMHLALEMCVTPLALVFDSDIEMIESPIELMVSMVEPHTYGVGYVEKTAYDGYEYGCKAHHFSQPHMFMMHPFFHLLQRSEYFKFHPYVHHGAPCYKAALDIHLKGLTDKVYKILPELGHTAGKGWVWDAVPAKWVRHDTAGTRKDRTKKGKSEIEPNWE
jgi:hypothetical protein